MSVALDVMSKEFSNNVNSMNGRRYDNGDSTDGTRVTGGRNHRGGRNNCQLPKGVHVAELAKSEFS